MKYRFGVDFYRGFFNADLDLLLQGKSGHDHRSKADNAKDKSANNIDPFLRLVILVHAHEHRDYTAGEHGSESGCKRSDRIKVFSVVGVVRHSGRRRHKRHIVEGVRNAENKVENKDVDDPYRHVRRRYDKQKHRRDGNRERSKKQEWLYPAPAVTGRRVVNSAGNRVRYDIDDFGYQRDHKQHLRRDPHKVGHVEHEERADHVLSHTVTERAAGKAELFF